MFRFALIAVGFLWGLNSLGVSLPPVLNADILDKENSEKLFTYMRIEKPVADGSEVKRTFLYPDGRLAVEELVFYKEGRSKRFHQKHPQIGAEGEFEVKGGRVFFSYTQAGKTRTSEEDYTPNFVSVDEIVPQIYDNMERLRKGETHEVRLAVLDRRETVGFDIFQIDNREKNGKSWMVFKMKPSNFIISALVDPLYFYAETTGDHRIFEVDGRVVPKKEVAGKFKNLDALFRVNW